MSESILSFSEKKTDAAESAASAIVPVRSSDSPLVRFAGGSGLLF